MSLYMKDKSIEELIEAIGKAKPFKLFNFTQIDINEERKQLYDW